MPKPDLSSVHAKLDGAEYRLNKFTKAVRDGTVSDLVEFRTDRDEQGRVQVRVKEILDSPAWWHVCIGEIVHNMRTALDHIAYGLNVLGSGQNPPPNRDWSQFPLYTGKSVSHGTSRFNGMVAKSSGRDPLRCPVLDVPPNAVAAMERLQPYHRWDNPPDFDTLRLWELVELSNIDKHRRFPFTFITMMGSLIPKAILDCPVTDWDINYEGLEPDAVVAVLECPTLPVHVENPQVHFGFVGAIEFDWTRTDIAHPGSIAHDEVPFALNDILKSIRSRVIPEFEPFFV